MSVKVCVASSRVQEIGKRCTLWAQDNLPAGHKITGDPAGADIFVSVLYDKLLTPEYVRGRMRCVNFHPGILPHYRGAGAYSWALINRESETGVTLHEIDYHIDSGPLIAIERTFITETDTAHSLFSRCMDLLFEMFQAWFHRVLAGDYVTYPNRGGRLYLRRHLQEQMDLTHVVRALTFPGKPGAYYVDKAGRRHDLVW